MYAVVASERGVVLIVALLILLLIGILAGGVYQGNLVQMRMAGNAQQHSELRQQGLALVDAILANPDNFVLRGAIGYRLCADGSMDEACDAYSLAVNHDLVPGPGDWQYAVIRRGPLSLPLPAVTEAHASSARHYRAALYDIRVRRQGDAQGRGRIALAQGVLLHYADGASSARVSP